MEKLSISVRPDQLELIEQRVEDGEADSRSAALRGILDEYETVREECEAVRSECEELRTRCERLENEKRLILEDREEKAELVEYAERQRTLDERRAEAGLATRAKWWLLGMDDGEA